MAKDPNDFNFRKEVAGFNITGEFPYVHSWGGTVHLGPVAFTPNIKDGELDVGWSIKGTGIYRRKAFKYKFPKIQDWIAPEPDFGHKEPMWDDDK